MKIDTAGFPIVRMGAGVSEDLPTESALALFSELLARDRPFIFMSEGDMTGGSDDVADRKKVSLWMKANKAEIRRLVKGHVHVQPDAGKRLAAKAFAIISEKFWGYPMFIVASVEEGRDRADVLLAPPAPLNRRSF